MIYIICRIFHLPETFYLVYILERPHETMSNKLILLFILVYNIYLPIKEICYSLAIPAFPFIFIRRIGNSVPWIKIFPSVYIHPPIIHSPFFRKLIYIAFKLIFYIISESDKIIMVINISGFYFIIHLITDNCRMFRIPLHQFPYYAFRIETISRIHEIHILPDTIICLSSTRILCQNFRMPFCHPSGNRISRSTQNNFYTGFMHFIQYPIHPFKLENSLLRLKYPPRRFTDPNHIYSIFLH